MTEYTLVTKNRQGDFIDNVNELLKDGWQFHGETIVLSHSDRVYYIQAFVINIQEGL